MYGMGVLVQIRDVDEDVRDRLKRRAAEDGVSLNALLREVLRRESEIPSRSSVVARIRARGDLVDAPVSAVEVLTAARSERDADLLGDRYDLDSAPNR